ncbi:SpaA isopeptide-forming pilin-related protein [Catenibacterium sp.]|uniref:SpaA isopeptide-forming pilin-related protein n=1 Tax=Catenibacterium sp. TaxID=2049022 RepID=UPI003AB18DC2
MKLMKRILAIVCTFVMIISMATGVNAVEPSKAPAQSQSKNGTITVEKAKAGETYKIYKILTLESYDEANNAYSYVRNAKPDKWFDFVGTEIAQEFLKVNDDGYVTFRDTENGKAGARKFALVALKYAKDNNIPETAQATATADKADNNTVKFTGLDLGYYLVESSVGSACSIDTTHPNATIEDKHEAPTVTKKIKEGGKISTNERKNTVDLGEVVGYETTINLKPNTQKLVLHDKMDSNLMFIDIQHAHVVKKDGTYGSAENLVRNTDFTVTTTNDDKCTFEIKFNDSFYQRYGSLIDSGEITQIIITYVAQVGDDAPINTAMLNKTFLTYGNNSKSQESQTETWTFGIPVFKYTGDDTALAGAKFILSRNNVPTPENAISFIDYGSRYRYTESGQNVELVSSKDGEINIEGLKQGTYYLKEIQAPKGYNLLKSSIEIVVREDGKILVKNEIVEKVKVQNNKGSLLPSTGGMGTTLIYVVGSILVLASGIVLFSKRKEGTN